MTGCFVTDQVPVAFTAGIVAVPLMILSVLLPEKFCTNPKISAVKLIFGSAIDCRVAAYESPESFRATALLVIVKSIASWVKIGPGKVIFKVPFQVPKRRLGGAGFGAGLATFFFPPQAKISRIGKSIKRRFIGLCSFLGRTFPILKLNPAFDLSSPFLPGGIRG